MSAGHDPWLNPTSSAIVSVDFGAPPRERDQCRKIVVSASDGGGHQDDGWTIADHGD